MIERILPSGVAVAEAFGDPAGAVLHPEEAALVARSVDKRRREFTTVRHCARRALGDLGYAPAPILPGPRGAPRWPAGVVGSMTHCDGYRAAVLGRVDAFAAIGVDAEPHAPLPDGVLDAVALPAERARTAQVAAERPGVCWDRLLFSAKEAVYKAWFPLTRRWLDFAEADITFDPRDGVFAARLLVPGPLIAGRPVGTFHGRYTVDGGLALTAIALRHEQR
ncbi:4'-phosphopantetheinyl transferase superfamily protein [Micromonospora sp. CPCC 205711]|uniref:4'-phosphopantetheinyl transferase family protein n=1 Tax=Micromonospora sp. CPCC 205547 TaxID=3122400 RepID=UPI002FF0CE6E